MLNAQRSLLLTDTLATLGNDVPPSLIDFPCVGPEATRLATVSTPPRQRRSKHYDLRILPFRKTQGCERRAEIGERKI
jgi:hypothetical protein